MTPHRISPWTVAVLLATALPLAACHVDVRKQDDNGKAEVDITTPVGDVSVRTGVDSPNTGLPVYPGAQPLRDEDKPESADVNVGNSMFGVKVVAARFESPDAQDKVLDFYRREMASLGNVTECQGDIDFRGRRDERHPECREKRAGREVQLLVGTENDQRIVAIKPRGTGTEFGLVSVKLRGKS